MPSTPEDHLLKKHSTLSIYDTFNADSFFVPTTREDFRYIFEAFSVPPVVPQGANYFEANFVFDDEEPLEIDDAQRRAEISQLMQLDTGVFDASP